MKLYRHLAKFAFAAAAMVLAASCSNGNGGSSAISASPADTSSSGQMVVRYIDGDSLMANYVLAKEINEAMLRRSNQLDSEQQKRGAEITRFGNEIQNIPIASLPKGVYLLQVASEKSIYCEKIIKN